MTVGAGIKVFIIIIVIFSICSYLLIYSFFNSIINMPVYNDTKAYPGIYSNPKNIQINFSFLLQPFSQQPPRVFINGEWKLLPRSQNNMIANDRLAVCGNGGLYIYNMTSDNTENIYNQEWYPCYNIYFLNKSSLVVESITGNTEILPVKYYGERITFDIASKKIVGNETITEDDVLNRYTSYHDSHVGIKISELCSNDNSTCTRLYNGDDTNVYKNTYGIVSIIYNNGSVQNTGIINVIDLVGLKDNILFYAIDCSHGSVLNHCLYAYDINKDISERLLSDFRFDYEIMVFFPEK
jgi:hypothetical protein